MTIFLRINFSLLFILSNFNSFSQILTDCGYFSKDEILKCCPKSKYLGISNEFNEILSPKGELSIEIFKLKDLEEISLTNIPIKTLSKDVKGLTKLKVVFISNTKLKSIPVELISLDSLRALYLVNGKFKTIFPLFMKSNNLISLSVQGNNNLNYDSIGFYLKNTNITYLAIGCRKFKKLDSSILLLQKLEWIRIDDSNKLDYSSIFYLLNQLSSLNTIQFNNCIIEKSDIVFIKNIRPNIRLIFDNCFDNDNSLENLKLSLINSNDVIINSGPKLGCMKPL